MANRYQGHGMWAEKLKHNKRKHKSTCFQNYSASEISSASQVTMTSILARRTTQVVCNRVAHTHIRRQIHLNTVGESYHISHFRALPNVHDVVQSGWFGNLLRGSKTVESEEKPQPQVTEKVEPQSQSGPTKTAVTTSDATVKSTSTMAKAVVPSTSEASAPKGRYKIKRKPLSSETKTSRFQENISFLEPRLGRRPEVKLPRIRKTTWIRTLGVCQSEEELRKVMALLPLWRDMGNNFDAAFSEAFIRTYIHY